MVKQLTPATRREKLYNLMHIPYRELGEAGKPLSRIAEDIVVGTLIEMVSEIADDRLEEKIDEMNTIITGLANDIKGEVYLKKRLG